MRNSKSFYYILMILIIMITTAKIVTAVNLFELLVEPDEPTQYDKINVLIKPLVSLKANITISGVSTNLTNIDLTENDDYKILENRFLSKGSYTVSITEYNDSNNSDAESFSIKEPVPTAGKCGDRVCQIEENYRTCGNDCYNVYSSSGNVCYTLTGQKTYFHFGNLFNDTNYTLSDDIERLGSEASYDTDTKEYCAERDSGALEENDQFYMSRNGLNWNLYIYGERSVPEDRCKTAADCDDSNECTLDYCTGLPKNCSHVPIQGCVVAACGDSSCNPSENQNNCPKDCGCPAGKILSDNTCVENQTINRSVCGDNICASDESSSSCCQDCSCGSGFSCINNSCQKQEVVAVSAPAEKPRTNILVLSLIALALVASVGVLFAIRRVHRKQHPELGNYVTNMRMQGYTDYQIKEQLSRFYGQEAAEKILRDTPR